MFIFFGVRNITIRKYNGQQNICRFCGKEHTQFRVRQSCFHIFFIPLFPVSSKYVEVICRNCKSRYEATKEELIIHTRTPFYMFSGLILICCIFILALITGSTKQKKTKEYVESPIEGDVYLIKDKHNNETVYYFSKIAKITADSIYLNYGLYNYNRYVSKMDRKDSFDSIYYFSYHKSQLKKWYDDNIIKKVIRK